jgi:hypothetical protein
MGRESTSILAGVGSIAGGVGFVAGSTSFTWDGRAGESLIISISSIKLLAKLDEEG